MKRFLKLICTSFVFIVLFSFTAIAAEQNIDTYIEEFELNSVLDTLNGETLQILEEIGVSEISLENIFSVKPQKIFDALFNIITNSVEKPFKFLVACLGILMLNSLISSFTKNSEAVNIIGVGALSLNLCVPIAQVTSTAFSVLEGLMVFTTAFAGVFCALISSSGSFNLGVSYGALTVFFDTVMSSFLVNLSQPLVNALCSLGFLSCFDIYGFTVRITGIVKKLYIFILSLVSTMFSGILTLKGILGGSVDSLTSRGVRFVIGQSLPVVGGAVSESYATLTQSLSLIKNTVGVFGIITVVVFILPTALELLSWVLVLELVSGFATAFGIDKCTCFLSVLKDALMLLISTLVILTTVFIVCVGVAIAAKDGAL